MSVASVEFYDVRNDDCIEARFLAIIPRIGETIWFDSDMEDRTGFDGPWKVTDVQHSVRDGRIEIKVNPVLDWLKSEDDTNATA